VLAPVRDRGVELIMLDLGGVGRYRHWLPGGRLVTCDLGVDHRPDVVGRAERLPLRDESFDLVLSTEMLEHCPEPVAVADEAHRVLRPGGTLVLTTPFVYVVHGWPADYYRYTASGLRHLFRRFSRADVVSFGNRFVVIYDLIVGFAPFLSNFANRAVEPLVRETTSTLCPAGHVLVATK
jgi:SAM-dependent methyltransferase